MSEEVKMNISEMVYLCKIYGGIQNPRVQVIGHEIRPGTYDWNELAFEVSGVQEVNELPVPNGDIIGIVYKYTGPTTDQYTTGKYYECANIIPRYEYIDFFDLNQLNPRTRHRIRKFMGVWRSLY